MVMCVPKCWLRMVSREKRIMMKKLMLLAVAVCFMGGCGDCAFFCKKKDSVAAVKSSCCGCDDHKKADAPVSDEAATSDEVVASEVVASHEAAAEVAE